jgi:hypothetical protein
MSESEIEPYPDELPKIKRAFERLQREFTNTPMTSSSQRHFDLMASNLFGEAGFKVNVEWRELAKVDGGSLGIHQPLVTLIGRVKAEEETDHDRLAHNIRAGLADGKKGVIDVNTGLLKEEPSKKLII